MAKYGFRPTTPEAPEFKSVNNPFWRLTLDVRDLENAIYELPSTWTKDTTSYTTGTNEYWNYIGLQGANASIMNLTKTFTFDKAGYYLIFLRYWQDSGYTGKIRLYVDDKLIGGEINPKNWASLKTAMLPITYFDKGDRDFKITLGNSSQIGEVIIYPITRYVATNDKSCIERKTESLDVLDIEFTENSVNESNILTASISLEDQLFNENNESVLFSELSDPISLELGHNYKDAQCKFGGYVIAPTLSNDQVELKCMDRMMDLVIQSKTTWGKNACIGTAPDASYAVFNDVYHIGQFYANTCEYHLTFDKLLADELLSLYYGSKPTYNKTTVVAGYGKTYGKYFGLLINPASVTNSGEIVLWQSPNTFDAKKYIIVGFVYNKGALANGLPVNLSIYMHKAGQTLSQAVKYNVTFTGITNPTNKIGTIGMPPPGGSTNVWAWAEINLKTAFDTYAPSSEYNISKISLTGIVDSTMASNPSAYGMYVRFMSAYKPISDAPQYSNSDIKTHFEGLQKLCEETNYISYIIPNRDRYYDKLYMAPQGLTISPVNIDENVNLIDVNSWNYDPLNEGLCNCRFGEYATTSAPDTKLVVYSENRDSIIKYRRIKSFEELSEVHSSADANTSVQRFVTENSIKKIGTEVTVEGNVLFRPTQYVLTNIGSKRLRGNYQIKGISQKLDIDNSSFETTLGLNKLPGRFRQRQRILMNFLKNYKTTLY